MTKILGQQEKRRIFVAAAALVLAIIACGDASTPEPTDTAEPGQIEQAVTECANDALLVDHINIQDGAVMSPGESFEKIWRLENSGNCAWPAGTIFELAGGEPLGSPLSVVLGQEVAPGEQADLAVPFTAPTEPGVYASFWQMRSLAGDPFGSQVSLEIVVEQPAGGAALSSLKDELFFASSHPMMTTPCQQLGGGILVVLQAEPLPVLILPTRQIYEIEGIVKPTPALERGAFIDDVTAFSPSIMAEIVRARPELLTVPDTPTATPVPAELTIVDRGAGSFIFCIAGVPRDQEITVRLRSPDGQVYPGSFIWPSGSDEPLWQAPQVSGASDPVWAGDTGIALGIRIPFGSFPAGEWSVRISGGGLDLNDAWQTESVPKIAIPDYHRPSPYDTVPVLPDCATFELSPGTRISITGAGFTPGMDLPIGFYSPGLEHAIAVRVDDEGRFNAGVDAGEFNKTGYYTAIAVLDAEREIYLDNSPQLSCFRLQ